MHGTVVSTTPIPLPRVSPDATHVRADAWWESAAVYQVYLRSFADSNGDGIGDLLGLTEKLPHLAALGVDAVWVTPFYASPMVDGGYDVSNYRAVDPLFGDEAAARAMVSRAHELGLRVVVEVVPNHVSSVHPWFQAALGGDLEAREMFHFRGNEDGEVPNNWASVFGGPAWSPEGPIGGVGGQHYLHLFSPLQPDLNWNHPQVRADFEETLRFWLDRGVDGFRVDVAHGLHKDDEYRDNPSSTGRTAGAILRGPEESMVWDQEEVHDVYRGWRALVESYGSDKVLLGEVGLRDLARMKRYLRPDELHLGFNFHLMHQEFERDGWVQAVTETLTAMGSVDATPSWVMSNHDKPRMVRRFGGGELGRTRARAAHLMTCFLPGAMFLYQGDELGLDDGDAVGDDPMNTTGGGTSRDGCRVPMPWEPEGVSCGFSRADGWLTQPTEYRALAVAEQAGRSGSMLELVREALALRKDLSGVVDVEPLGSACLRLTRGAHQLLVNFGDEAVRVRVHGQVLLGTSGGRGSVAGAGGLWVRGIVDLA